MQIPCSPDENLAASRYEEVTHSYDVIKEQDTIADVQKRFSEAKDCQYVKEKMTDTNTNSKNLLPSISITKSSNSSTLQTSQENSAEKDLSTSVEQLHALETKPTKLKWRAPSQEALNKLHSSQLAARRQEVSCGLYRYAITINMLREISPVFPCLKLLSL